jgi:hypothetical protein
MFVLIRALLLALAMGVDLSGSPITQLAPAGTKAVVLFFAASDCPISKPVHSRDAASGEAV